MAEVIHCGAKFRLSDTYPSYEIAQKAGQDISAKVGIGTYATVFPLPEGRVQQELEFTCHRFSNGGKAVGTCVFAALRNAGFFTGVEHPDCKLVPVSEVSRITQS